jgi:hypothetical protein
VVEELAVENDGAAPVLVPHGLLAVRDARDAQPAGNEPDSGSNIKAFFVRSPMEQSPGHCPKPFSVWLLISGQIDHSCDSTHKISESRWAHHLSAYFLA